MSCVGASTFASFVSSFASCLAPSSASSVVAVPLLVCEEGGVYRPALPEEVLGGARALLNKLVCRGAVLDTSAATRAHLVLQLGALEHEVFYVLFLDSQHRLINAQEMFRGTVAQTSVYPREVVKEALRQNCRAVVLAHNHPSGAVEPSRADESITKVLRDALALVDVRVLDHIIVGGGNTFSFAEAGLL